MRIDRLDLTAFGPFTDATLDLSGGSEGLHLIYGPNEAGKSSALRAIRQLFCGIPHVSPDDFVHPYAAMRVGASLRDRSGATLDLVRLKRARNSLVRPDGAAVEGAETVLARFLGGTTPQDFLQRFVIDHAELVAGGRALIGGGGDLGRTLFAGSGFTGLASVQKALEQEAEALYKPKGTNPPINLKLRELEEGKKRFQDGALKSSEWVARDEALKAARARRAELERELAEAGRERNRLARFAEAVEPAARRRAALDELRGLAGVPILSKNFGFTRTSALSFILSSENQESEALREVDKIDRELASLDIPGPLLDEAKAVEDLYLRHGRQQQSAQDRDRLAGERDQLTALVRSALRELGHDPGPGGLPAEGEEPPRITAAVQAEVRSLAAARPALFAARDAAEAALRAHDATRAEEADALGALGPVRDPAALRKAVQQARAHGDLDARLARDREALDADGRRAAAGLAALGLWSGPLDALEALAVPPVERVEGFRDRFDALEALAGELRKRADDLDAEARRDDARLEQLRLGGDVPTEDDLTAARARRDRVWRRLAGARAWDDADAAAFEADARLADDLADRLRREAGRVSERAGLLADRARLAADRAALAGQAAEADARARQTRADWAELWAPLGVAAPWDPRAMLGWLRRQADLAALARTVREAREAVRLGDRQRVGHRRALLDALAGLGAPGLGGEADGPLADLVERAQGVIEAVAEESSARKRLLQGLAARDRDRPALADRADLARSEALAWESRWAAAVGRLGLAPDAPPEAAEAVLRKSAELFDRLDAARAHARTLDGLAREAARFAEDVRALAARAAPDLLAPAGFDPGAVAARLYDRLTRARSDREKREALLARRLERAQAAQAAGETITHERGRLAALCREARCSDEADLPAVEERSARRQKLEAELEDLNAGLFKLAAGAPLEDFLAEAAGEDPDALGPRVAHLSARVDALGRERSEVDQAIGREQTLFDQMDGGPKAADAGQDAEDLRARIKADVEQYARLRLASAVLRAGIERYRKAAQGPVLDRASGLFERLTLGSFAGLRVEYDDRDQPVLQGVRPGGKGGLGVEGMSLGTADQLYLAIRLATLENYLAPEGREPLPLVVDDILIQFDDGRAAATLGVLADLSTRTQVLLFTHHGHLRDLAEAHAPPGTLVTHNLPGPEVAFRGLKGGS